MVNSTPVFCITCSIYSMMALSVERYRSILVEKKKPMQPRHAGAIIALIWLFCFGLSLPTMVTYQRVEETHGNNTTILLCKPTLPYEFNIFNGLLILIVGYVVPQCVVYFNYGSLLMFILRRNTIGPAPTGPAPGAGSTPGAVSAVARHRVKIIKMLVWAAALFTISWIPYFVLGTMAVSYSNAAKFTLL